MKTKNLFVNLDKFLQSKKIRFLLIGINKIIKLENNSITLYNTASFDAKKEEIKVFTDQERKLRCIGETIDFTLNTENNTLYFESLSLGNTEKKDYPFQMRRNKNGDYNIKMITEKEEVFFHITKNYIKLHTYQDYVPTSYQPYFTKNSTNIVNKNKLHGYIIELEKACPAITSFIGEEIPLFNDLIEFSIPWKKKQNRKIIPFPKS